MLTMTRLAATASLLACLSTPAQAWEYRDFVSPQGDRGTGIVQPAEGDSGIELAFGCEGNRWRQVALLPEGPDAMQLASDGQVAIAFDDGSFTPATKWKVRDFERRGASRAYFAPAASPFMGRLFNEEKRNPSGVLRIKLRPASKPPTTLSFPLKGMTAALTTHLWKPCKLDVYFGDPPE